MIPARGEGAEGSAIPGLLGERVCLTPVLEADLPMLYEWIGERSLVVLNGPYHPVGEAEHRAWFEAVQERTDLHLFAIRLLEDGELIGSCQLHGVSPVHRSAELQIRIGAGDRLEKGFGTEAVRLLLSFAFMDLNLERVYLHVRADNGRAVRAYQKAGFAREGVLRRAAFIDGEYRDIVVMGILREEFRGDS